MDAIKKKYDFNKANDVISKFMDKEDDYKSLDKLISVWKEISGLLWDMNGFIFSCSFDYDYVSDADLSSNWTGQGLGGYSDAISFDCSIWDDDNPLMTVQERALIVTAQIINYQIYKNYSFDFSRDYKYYGLTKDFLEKESNIDYSKFKYLSQSKTDYLIDLIKEKQLPPHMMEHAISNLAFYNKNDNILQFIMNYLDSEFSIVRRGIYRGIYYFRDKKDVRELLIDLRLKDKSKNNKIEIDRFLRTINREMEEKRNDNI